jgi:hypothetical protein
VKLPDVNLFLYTVNHASPQHEKAKRWVDDLLSGPETVGLAPAVAVGFVRASTHAGIFPRPLDIDQAFSVVDGWLARPNVTMVHPTRRHTQVMRELLDPLGVGGNLVSDAHLAALAIEHGAELCSSDVDFSRFSGLRWTNPLS